MTPMTSSYDEGVAAHPKPQHKVVNLHPHEQLLRHSTQPLASQCIASNSFYYVRRSFPDQNVETSQTYVTLTEEASACGYPSSCPRRKAPGVNGALYFRDWMVE